MSVFKDYRKKHVQSMRPYIVGEDMMGISVSSVDTPEEGGMIAVSAIDTTNQWYISKDFFNTNYEEVV